MTPKALARRERLPVTLPTRGARSGPTARNSTALGLPSSRAATSPSSTGSSTISSSSGPSVSTKAFSRKASRSLWTAGSPVSPPRVAILVIVESIWRYPA